LIIIPRLARGLPGGTILDVFGLSISHGGLMNMLQRVQDRFAPGAGPSYTPTWISPDRPSKGSALGAKQGSRLEAI